MDERDVILGLKCLAGERPFGKYLCVADCPYHEYDACDTPIAHDVLKMLRARNTDAIPVEWLCGKIRYEDERGNVLKAEYLKELIFEWHQSEVDA